MKFARNFALVALVALIFTAAPGGGATLSVLLTALSIVFFTAIALLGVRLYSQNQFTLDSLTERQRLVLYGSIGGAFLVFTGTERLFDQGGGGFLLWVAALAGCSYGVFWVFARAREY